MSTADVNNDKDLLNNPLLTTENVKKEAKQGKAETGSSDSVKKGAKSDPKVAEPAKPESKNLKSAKAGENKKTGKTAASPEPVKDDLKAQLDSKEKENKES